MLGYHESNEDPVCKEGMMPRLPLGVLYRMVIAIAIGSALAFYAWVYLLYRLGLEAHARGTAFPTSSAVLGASVPVGIALVYCGWLLLRHSPMIQGALRAWLRDGRLFRFDRNRRLLSLFDSVMQTGEAWGRWRTSVKARIARHPAWQWGGKPAAIGLLAVLAASPLLAVSPVVADMIDADISLNGVIALALLVWVFAALVYLAARATGYLDDRDRTPKARAARTEERVRISDLFGVRIDEAPEPPIADKVRDLLSKASENFTSRNDEPALQLYRQALRTAMGTFQHTQEGELLHLALIAYRGVAVSALVTGRNGEAAIAVETGLAAAAVGLRYWPDAPPLLEEQSLLSSLKQKTGIVGAVYLPDDFSDWISDD
jgi:hypothetical protein